MALSRTKHDLQNNGPNETVGAKIISQASSSLQELCSLSYKLVFVISPPSIRLPSFALPFRGDNLSLSPVL